MLVSRQLDQRKTRGGFKIKAFLKFEIRGQVIYFLTDSAKLEDFRSAMLEGEPMNERPLPPFDKGGLRGDPASITNTSTTPPGA